MFSVRQEEAKVKAYNDWTKEKNGKVGLVKKSHCLPGYLVRYRAIQTETHLQQAQEQVGRVGYCQGSREGPGPHTISGMDRG